MPPDASRPPWGWILPVRGLLAIASLAGAVGFLAIAPGDDDRPHDVPRLIVDPNTAPPAVLAALPRLGPSLVGRIVDARREAPIRSFEDLEARVRGVGPATTEALRDHLHFDPGPNPAGGNVLPPSGRVAHTAP